MPYFDYKGKNVFYEESGGGFPLLLLHGNTASSKMFELLKELYEDAYKVILIDFLGHGQSDRLESFPADLWFDWATQAIKLIEDRGYGKVNIIGTSGGALAALNVALERGDLVNKIIADSFEGEHSLESVTNFLPEERKQSKASEAGREFWDYCHGGNWDSIVDNDTAAAAEHHRTIGGFFHRELSELSMPVLLTASLEDEFSQIAGLSFGDTYAELLKKIPDGKMRLFETGGHPAMISNAEEFARVAKEFFGEKE